MTDFKEGDKVIVSVSGKVERSGLIRLQNNELFNRVYAKSIELIERAGRPLEVGEVVLCSYDNYSHRWLLVHTDNSCQRAWLAWDGDHIIQGIHKIKRPCGTPITEAKS